MPTLDVATKLERLQEHIERWDRLDWKDTRLEIPKFRISNYAGGVLVTAGDHVITCVELPSLVRRTEARVWSHTNPDFPIFEVAIDPSQDMLVLLHKYVPTMCRFQTIVLIRVHLYR